jgi:hypothetical protein
MIRESDKRREAARHIARERYVASLQGKALTVSAKLAASLLAAEMAGDDDAADLLAEVVS